MITIRPSILSSESEPKSKEESDLEKSKQAIEDLQKLSGVFEEIGDGLDDELGKIK